MCRNVHKQARQNLLEFLSEILVQPRVEKRIVHNRRHGKQVTCEEEEVVIFVLVEVHIEVIEDVDEVEGKPAHAEDRHHKHQHLVCCGLLA